MKPLQNVPEQDGSGRKIAVLWRISDCLVQQHIRFRFTKGECRRLISEEKEIASKPAFLGQAVDPLPGLFVQSQTFIEQAGLIGFIRDRRRESVKLESLGRCAVLAEAQRSADSLVELLHRAA